MAANQEISLLTLTAATTGTTGSDMNAANFKGVIVFIDIDTITGTIPTLTVTLQGKSARGGEYYTILTSAALGAAGATALRVYPGLVGAANLTANDILPPTYRVTTAIGGTTPVVTGTVSAVLVA